MIELTNVTQHYGVQPVLRRTDLRIEAGELVVLASGPDEALGRCEPVFDAVGSV